MLTTELIIGITAGAVIGYLFRVAQNVNDFKEMEASQMETIKEMEQKITKEHLKDVAKLCTRIERLERENKRLRQPRDFFEVPNL